MTVSPSGTAKDPTTTMQNKETSSNSASLSSLDNTSYYDNASSRGVVVAASKNVAITDLKVACVVSQKAEGIGIDIREGSSDVALRRWSVRRVSSDAMAHGKLSTVENTTTPVAQTAFEIAPDLTDISLGSYRELCFTSANC